MYKFLQDGKWYVCDDVEVFEENNTSIVYRGIGYSLYLDGDIQYEKTVGAHLDQQDEVIETETIFDLLEKYPIEARSDPRFGDVYISLFYRHGKLKHESAFDIRKEIERRFGIHPYGATGNELYHHFLTPCIILDQSNVLWLGLYDIDSGRTSVCKWLLDSCYSEDEFAEKDKLLKEKIQEYLTAKQ